MTRPLSVLFALVLGCNGSGGPAVDASDSAETRDTRDTSDSGSATPGRVRITEGMTDNEDTLEDAAGETPDWIELYNPGPSAVDLGGWTLMDGDHTAVLEAGELPPGGFVVVFASGEASTATERHLPFKLSDEGAVVRLLAPDGVVVDELVVPALREDTSWGPEQPVAETVVVDVGSAAVASGAPPEGWTTPTFDDSSWSPVTLGVGFDGAIASGDPTNVALGQPTTQSSDGYGYTGAQAVDGEPSTFSHTGDADLAPWWAVDLGGTWSIDEISIYNRADCCGDRLYNLTVRVIDATGAEVWASDVLNPVVEGATPGSPGSVLLAAPPTPVVGSAVRVEKTAVNGAYSSEWMSLGEVEVRAVAAAPYGSWITSDVGDLVGDATLAVRVPIDVDEAPDRARLDLRYDDGVRVWLDGELLLEANAGDGAALGEHPGTALESFSLDASAFTAGSHVLAFEIQNVAIGDDDLLLVPTLTLQRFDTSDTPAMFAVATPGEPNGSGVDGLVEAPIAAPERGFFDAPTEVTLTAPTPGSTLVYTLDGSAPTADHGRRVEPGDVSAVASTTVPITTTSLVRAVALREGWADSDVVTDTYLFLDDVIAQPALPAGLPATWDGISEAPYAGNYEMDPEVVDDPAYHDDLLAGLREIPTLSVVMDPADLWDSATGLYINSAERGDQWEKPASVELILPDGTTGFSETCGIRVHGYGWRYHSSTLKHSFRLEFSDKYGPSKLHYPLFADSPVERFDSVVLRAGGSKTWLDFRDPANAQYLHDAFARDTARDMGKLDGHATYVHLYLNGLYWGLYNPVERPEAGFGEEYLGGDDDEYDAINRRTTTNEAIDGTLDAYLELLARADADLSTPEGLASVEDMLDLDDLIDYMLIHQYMTNRDGPCCFESNNMRGLRRRAEGEQFRFFVWDMEYSLWDATDDTNVDIDVAGSISHVYTRLRQNPDFRARFAARARMHLTGDGALTPAAAEARYAARAEEIFDPLVAESARWGDTYRATPYTRDVEWQAEYDRLMTEYFPRRTDELIAQLTAAGLY